MKISLVLWFVIPSFCFCLGIGQANKIEQVFVRNQPSSVKPIRQELSESDKQLLLGLIGDPLTDPTGKEYCTVSIVTRNCWGATGESKVAAWYQSATNEHDARIYFADGDWIAANDEPKRRDFLAETKKRLAPVPADGGENNDQAFEHMRMVAAASAADAPDIVRAAWLAKLGHEELAAQVLEAARNKLKRRIDVSDKRPPDEIMVQRLDADFAWRAYADAVHAFMVGADEDALRHAKRLNEQYPDYADEYGDGKALLAELERIEEAGMLGEPALEKPEDFDGWKVERQVQWLVDQLEHVDARQRGQPGGVSLASDWRIQALIEIGDPAVEKLIDTVEIDQRLTRSVHFWRDFARSRTVLSVREGALTGVMSILKVSAFEPSATGDNFTSRGEGKAVETANRLRSYWEKYGGMTFPDRMMAVLVDEASRPDALREAARNIELLGRDRTLSTTVFSETSKDDYDKKPKQAILKRSDPTAAEAILAAMDRDLAQHDLNKDDRLWDYKRQRIEGGYISAINSLGDKRIAPALGRRCDQAETVRMRLYYACSLHTLGDSKPISLFADEFSIGEILLPPSDRARTNWTDQPGTRGLAGIVQAFAWADTKQCNAALMALASEDHPYYPVVARSLRNLNFDWGDSKVWFSHPYCIKVLRTELNDTAITDTEVFVEGERYVKKSENGKSTGGIPPIIAEPDSRQERVRLRRCDLVAQKLSKLVVGLPDYHPLLKDADDRLDQMKKELDKGRSLRTATAEERKERGLYWEPLFVFE